MEQLNTIKELINQGNVEQAILQLDEILQTDFPEKDEAYYLRGNAYRKQSSNRSRHRTLQRLQPVCRGLSAQCNSPHQRGECKRV